MTSVSFTAKATDPTSGLSGSLSASFNVQSTVAPLLGARGGPTNALSLFNTANSTIGPLNCTKLFYSTVLPTTYVGSIESTYPVGVTPVVCYKTMNTNVAAYVNSVTRPVWLVYHQEPEGDYPLGSTFVSEFNTQSALIRAQGNPLVKVVCCSAGFPYRAAGTADVLAGNYIPPASSVDYYCKDVYQDQGSLYPTAGLSNYPIWTNWYSFVSGSGKPIGITEYGIGSTGSNADRNTRIQQDCAYLRASIPSLAMWQYWWSNVGTDPATTYQFTDTATIATWQGIEAGTI